MHRRAYHGRVSHDSYVTTRPHSSILDRRREVTVSRWEAWADMRSEITSSADATPERGFKRYYVRTYQQFGAYSWCC